jgi:hypothetical protein
VLAQVDLVDKIGIALKDQASMMARARASPLNECHTVAQLISTTRSLTIAFSRMLSNAFNKPSGVNVAM